MDDNAGGKRARDTHGAGPDAKTARTGEPLPSPQQERRHPAADAKSRAEAVASRDADVMNTTRKSDPNLPSVPDDVLGLPRGVFCKSLSFLADFEAPSGLLEISMSSKSFRAAALDCILWKEMCDKKWKTKFGHRFRMERAKKDDEQKDARNDSEFDLFVYRLRLRFVRTQRQCPTKSNAPRPASGTTATGTSSRCPPPIASLSPTCANLVGALVFGSCDPIAYSSPLMSDPGSNDRR